MQNILSHSEQSNLAAALVEPPADQPRDHDSESEFSFDTEISLQFAQLSGDFNPLHLDPLVARRLTYGVNLVHGVHMLLRAIDVHFRRTPRAQRLTELKAWFVEPVLHGDLIRCQITTADDGRVNLEALHGGKKVLIIDAAFADCTGEQEPPPSARFDAEPCHELCFSQAAAASGSVELMLDKQLCMSLLPHLTRCLPASQIAAILATTRIVGMRCPGLHSVYTKLRLRFEPVAVADHVVRFATKRSFQELSLLKIGLESSIVAGEMDAFFRRPPVVQPSFQGIQGMVAADEFVGQRALIVGGSRGLGEVAAKIIAAGGGHAAITYHRGQQDAEKVQSEIQSGGGVCHVLPWDVLAPPSATPEEAGGDWKPNSLYYFATPAIGLTKTFDWDHQRFESFCRYYVAGLRQTVAAIRDNWQLYERPLCVFFPSTVLLDTGDPIAAEYTAAKAAGESLCRFLEHERSGTRCVCRRLPRILTDQTNSLVSAESADSVKVLLDSVRSMNIGSITNARE